jgi:uncharacterized protein YbjT (DUF2867 family)
MKIAVIGASGNTGSIVAELALENGHDLRAVARNPDALSELANRGAEIVTADLDDQEGILSALSGVEAVYYCSPLPVGYDEPFAVERTWGVTESMRPSLWEQIISYCSRQWARKRPQGLC